MENPDYSFRFLSMCLNNASNAQLIPATHSSKGKKVKSTELIRVKFD